MISCTVVEAEEEAQPTTRDGREQEKDICIFYIYKLPLNRQTSRVCYYSFKFLPCSREI